MTSLFSVFEVIYSMMSQTTPLLPNELNEFDALCVGFGSMWREYFPGCNITPKMHLLESHVPAQMRRFGCLGDKSEAVVERYHQIVNRSDRILSAMKSFSSMTKAMLSRRDIEGSPTVVALRKRVQEETARPITPEKAAQKALAEEDMQQIKRLKVDNALFIVNLFG